MPVAGAPQDFLLGEGGLLRRIELRVHLTRLRPQLATAIALTWLPLLALGLATELLFGRRDPIIRDLSIHVRLLLAAPVFILIDGLFPRACRNALSRLTTESFVRPGDSRRFEGIVRSARRLTDSPLPEVLLAVVALASGVAGLLGAFPIGGLARAGRPGPSQVWYALVAWPFFQFLLWRSLWRWLVWSRALFGISRLDLALVPAHPDKRGGITFLSQPSISYCTLLVFAMSSVLSAEWAERISIPSVEKLAPLVVAYGAVAALIAFGPLLLFALMLERARNAGIDECGEIATSYARKLAAENASRGAAEAADVVAPEQLAYMTIIFNESADRVRNVLFDRRDVIVLLIATLLPLVPVVLAQIPKEDWTVLLKMVLGGRLH